MDRVGSALEGALKLSEFPYVTVNGFLPIVLDVSEVPPNRPLQAHIILAVQLFL